MINIKLPLVYIISCQGLADPLIFAFHPCHYPLVCSSQELDRCTCIRYNVSDIWDYSLHCRASSPTPQKYVNTKFIGWYNTEKSLKTHKEVSMQDFCPIHHSIEAPHCGELGASHQAPPLLQWFNTNPYNFNLFKLIFPVVPSDTWALSWQLWIKVERKQSLPSNS